MEEVLPKDAFLHRYMQASEFKQSRAVGMRNQSEWNTSLRLNSVITCMANDAPAGEGKGCWGIIVPMMHRKASQSRSPTVSRNDARFFIKPHIPRHFNALISDPCIHCMFYSFSIQYYKKCRVWLEMFSMDKTLVVNRNLRLKPGFGFK
jgi:hypothetical protein